MLINLISYKSDKKSETTNKRTLIVPCLAEKVPVGEDADQQLELFPLGLGLQRPKVLAQ